MEAFSLVFAAVAIGLAVFVAVRPENRGFWRAVRPADLAVYLLLAVLAAGVSVWHFDTIGNHAWRPHEEALWFALKGKVPPEGWRTLEVQTLLRLVYRGVGLVAGTSIQVFAVTALVLGVPGLVFAGMAGQLLCGSRWAGYGVALLLVFHPSLAYWRTNAFHVAVPQVLYSATLLLAIIVARRPDRVNVAAWFTLGALCLHLRLEQLGAVVATAAIPLVCGDRAFVRRWAEWVPSLVFASALAAVPALSNTWAAVDREDYRLGLRFLRYYVANPELWEPMSRPGFLALLGLGAMAALPRTGVPARLAAGARALAIVCVTGALPPILFISFGQRHLLASGTAASLLAMAGAAALVTHPRLARWRAASCTLAAGLLVMSAMDSWARLADWGSRYSQTEHNRVLELPDARVPTGPPDFDPDACATYANNWKLCGSWFWCHPPKDLTDPAMVRARWDELGGCVVWAVDETDGQVSGVRHEWWTVVSRMYRWEPLGRLTVDDAGNEVDVHLYRLAERP